MAAGESGWEIHGENRSTEVSSGTGVTYSFGEGVRACTGIGDKLLWRLAASYGLTRLFVWVFVFPTRLLGASGSASPLVNAAFDHTVPPSTGRLECIPDLPIDLWSSVIMIGGVTPVATT